MILTFHALANDPAPEAFPPRLFARGMAILQDLGFRAVGLPEWIAGIGGPAPPERAFVLTFDDGYRSIVEPLGTLLQSSDWSATVFLTAGEDRPGVREERLFGRALMGWEEAAALGRAGAAFGAHSLTHPDLTRLSPAPLEAEIRGSRKAIEERLGATVTAFAYPFGRLDPRTRLLVRTEFDCACTDRLAIAGSGDDRWALPRIDAHYLRSERGFAALATRWFPLYVRARAGPRLLRRAVAGRLRARP